MEIRPNFFEAYDNWGVILLNQGRLDEAVALFRRALEIEPESVGRYYLASALYLRGELDAAIEQYHVVLRYQPSFEPAQRGLEQALRMKQLQDRDATRTP